MIGLFEKDIRLTLSRKSSMVIFLMLGFIMVFQGGSGMAFVYLTVFGTILGVGTLSYDDSDNCMPFLMTLPCSRRDYVLEKYLFVGICALISALAGAAVFVFYCAVTHTAITADLFLESFIAFIPAVVLIVSIVIPMQLRFGAEKMRIALMAVYGVVLIVCLMMDYEETDLSGASEILGRLDPVVVTLIGLLACAVLAAVSVRVSVRIMEKKEF